MDKKNTIIGVLLLIAAFGIFIYAPRSAPPAQPENPPPATATSTTAAEPVATPAASSSTPAAASAAPATQPAVPPSSEFAPVNSDEPNGKALLENDSVRVQFTDDGGAIRDVALKHYPAVLGQPEPYVFNLVHSDPILAFTDVPGLDRKTRYELVRATRNEVVYRTVLDGKIEVTRTYELTKPGAPGADPYRIRQKTTFRNLTGAPIALRPDNTVALSIGTSSLVDSYDRGYYLNITDYNGTAFDYTYVSALAGGGIASWLGHPNPPKAVLVKPGSVVWAAAKSQFFSSIYTPDSPGTAVVVRRIELPPFPNSKTQNVGLTGATAFKVPPLAAHGTATLAGVLYVGPNEYKRLVKFTRNEDGVMQYSRGMYRIFLAGYVAPLENTLLNLAHQVTGNWGVAVIFMTLMLKTISLPFTLASSRSARRMAKIQPELKAIREKYKDNPQKQQTATMELFKAHKVNPVGGCIPILITLPLFFGFYAMLAGAAELRFQPFLWAHDLSAPDTVAVIFGIPLNIFPILMGATSILQTRLMPQPSVDNAQATMMKFMPLIYIVICYNFSCALSLYMTVNGLFSIGQQMIVNRARDTGDPTENPPASRSGRPVKNVTPQNKKLKR